MGRMTSKAGQMAKDALRRFPDVPSLTLARYLVANYSEIYNNDVERARTAIRFYRGKTGNFNREKAQDRRYYDQNVKMPGTLAKVRKPYNMPEGLWLVISDIHVPFHSISALETTIQYAHTQKVNGIFINGDAQDCEALSKWSPTGKRDFNREVELMIDFIDFLRGEFPDIPIKWKPGNHEDRLQLYYARNAPHLLDLPTSNLETMLSLDKREIEFLGFKQKVQFGKLPVLHGHEFSGSGYSSISPARWLYLKTHGSAMSAHFHRCSDHEIKTMQHKDIATYTTGCLCDLSPDYNPYANGWHNGFALINLEKNGQYQVENRKILSNGKII